MKAMIRHEFYKAFKNRIYRLTLCAALCFCVFVAVLYIVRYRGFYEHLMSLSSSNVADIPFTTVSLYNNWIGGITGFALFPTLFYFLLPLFVVIPNGLSYYHEAKSGYQRILILKAGKKKWLFAKYVSVFLSSASLVFIPIIANFLLIACFIPAYADPVEWGSYSVKSGQAFSYLFYTFPALYAAIYIILPSLFAGLWSCVCFMLSFFLKNKYAILFIPYVFLMFITDLASKIYYIVMYNIGVFVETSPFYFLRASNPSSNNSEVVMLLWLGGLFLITFFIILRKGEKSDVF